MPVDHREAAGRCALPDPEPDILFILRIERLKGYIWILGELIQEEPLPVLGILLPGEAPFELLPLLPLPVSIVEFAVPCAGLGVLIGWHFIILLFHYRPGHEVRR